MTAALLNRSFPEGYFAICFSDDLKCGEVKPLKFHNRELVLWRSANGTPYLQSAYCPHLGTHLGHCGKVEGEKIRCPFHGLAFNGLGNCSAKFTRNDGSPPLRSYPVREQNGVIYSAFDSSFAFAAWNIPELDLSNYLPAKTAVFKIHSTPLEITENTVDLLHFSALHKYKKPRLEMSEDGMYLRVKAFIHRAGDLFAKKDLIPIETTTHHYGLGYANVHINLPTMDMHFIGFVLPTSIDHENIELRFKIHMRKITRPELLHPVLRFLPLSLVNQIILWQSFRGFVMNIHEDLPIWQHKIHLDEPLLTEADGPIMPYRQWAEQFFTRAANKNPNFAECQSI